MFNKISKTVSKLYNKLFKDSDRNFNYKILSALVLIIIFIVVGVIYLSGSHATGPYTTNEAENGQVTGSATVNNDSNASGGKFVSFNSSYFGMSLGCCADAGAATNDAPLLSELTAMKAMHVKWLRLGLSWNDTETSQGKYNWGNIDAFVRDSNTFGFSILATISRVPAWARTPSCNTSQFCPPLNVADYANFAAAVSTRYKALGLHTFEIWNEPNFSNYWLPTPDAAQYTTLLKAAYTSIKAVDPNSTVITAGFSGDTNTNNTIQGPQFLQAIYDAGGKGYFDDVAYHPYCYAFLLTTGCPGGGPWANLTDNTPSLRSIMTAEGDANKQIWVTEYGAPDGAHNPSVTAAQQATLITNSYAKWKTYPWAGPLFWFNYSDSDAATITPAGVPEGFGIGVNPAAVSAYTQAAQ